MYVALLLVYYFEVLPCLECGNNFFFMYNVISHENAHAMFELKMYGSQFSPFYLSCIL